MCLNYQTDRLCSEQLNCLSSCYANSISKLWLRSKEGTISRTTQLLVLEALLLLAFSLCEPGDSAALLCFGVEFKCHL